MRFIDWLLETCRMPWFYPSLGIRSTTNDTILNHIMDNGIRPDRVSLSYLTATFGGTNVWLGNYPYAYGFLSDDKRTPRRLPTMRTAFRFNNYINKLIQEGAINATKTSINTED